MHSSSYLHSFCLDILLGKYKNSLDEVARIFHHSDTDSDDTWVADEDVRRGLVLAQDMQPVEV